MTKEFLTMTVNYPIGCLILISITMGQILISYNYSYISRLYIFDSAEFCTSQMTIGHSNLFVINQCLFWAKRPNLDNVIQH